MATIFDAQTGARPPEFANSGAGIRWFVNSAGIHTQVAGTAERIEYTFAGSILGLLNEPGDTSYCGDSRNFAAPTWFAGPNTTISTVSETNVDGASTATRDLATQSGSTIAKTAENGTPTLVGHSVYAKSRTGANQNWGFYDGSRDVPVTVTPVFSRIFYGPTSRKIFDFYPLGGSGDILLDCAMIAAGYTLNGVWYPGSFILTTGSNIGVRAADAYTFRLAAAAKALTFTFDDGSKQVISGLAGGTTYQIPILNRPWIYRIEDDTVAAVLRRRPLLLMAS